MIKGPGRFFADLHIHSRFSRATSRDLTVQSIFRWSQLKGIGLVGTADFTHPGWMEELSLNLVEDGTGLLAMRPEIAAGIDAGVPGQARRDVRFVICGEISSIYKKNGRTRKVHSLLFMPSLDAARRFSTALGRLGNIKSDGRPILGLDPLQILRLARDMVPESFMIPAHVWTPHFSVFGAMSGFDTLEECFEDMTGEIFAIETGLSSDVVMNRRWSALDRLALTSSSDAHSPSKLGREATILDGEVSWRGLVSALRGQAGPTRLVGTVEFFPEEGKYHVDGHRKCGFRCDPGETARLGGVCPVCGGRLTPGVLGRVEQVADRAESDIPAGFPGQIGLIPLAEILSEIQGCGPASLKVVSRWESLIARFGGELDILSSLDPAELTAVGEFALAEALRRMRAGRVFKEAGYDGEYGRIGIFVPGEVERLNGQGLMFGLGERQSRQQPEQAARAAVEAGDEPDLFSPDPVTAQSGLTDDQERAAACRDRFCLVVAGPGTGKTRTMVARAAGLVREGVAPDRILVVTFTNRAVGEARERLIQAVGEDACPPVSTFHALALRELVAAARREGREPPVVVEAAGGRASSGCRTASGDGAGSGRPASAGDGADMVNSCAPGTENQVTLDRLVPMFVEAIQSDVAAFQRFDHILVDEFQDISDDQYAMLELLAGDTASVFCVGDPDQSIYGFRGAVPEVFDRFVGDHPGASTHVIGLTHRLTPQVVDLASFVVGSHGAGSSVALKSAVPSRAGTDPVQLCHTRHARDEGAWVADCISALVGGLGMLDSGTARVTTGLGDIAVLGRTHQALQPVAMALDEAGLPYEQASDAPLWNQDWVKVVMTSVAAAHPMRGFEEVALEALKSAETVYQPRQFKSLLTLAAATECGPAYERLSLLTEVDAFGLDPQKVHLLTIHASKGLEFDNVFVVGCNDGMVPLVSGPDFDEDEERRLLYVAATRARRRLFLSWAEAGRQGLPKISRFLDGSVPAVSVDGVRSGRRRPVQQSLF